jgi:hypothetical protein
VTMTAVRALRGADVGIYYPAGAVCVNGRPYYGWATTWGGQCPSAVKLRWGS